MSTLKTGLPSSLTPLIKSYITQVEAIFKTETNMEIKKIYYRKLLEKYQQEGVETLALSGRMKALAAQAGESSDGL
jgi:hypothetical protein